MSTATYGLTHLAIHVSDIARTLKFYQQVFDMTVMYQEQDMLQLTTPGCHDILVFERKHAQIKTGGGIAHFGFRLRSPGDINIIYEKVVAAGGKIMSKGEFVPGSPFIFFKDPDGYTVEVWYELLPEAHG
jgi:predicted enzyme related to lactoylglutathione lyase